MTVKFDTKVPSNGDQRTDVTVEVSTVDATDEIHYPDRPEGPIVAAILAAGIGCLAIGVMTTLTEASATMKDKLTWSTAVGPLSGKVGVAIVVWLAAWAILHTVYRNRPTETPRAFIVSLVLIGLGLLGTFPPFFKLFG